MISPFRSRSGGATRLESIVIRDRPSSTDNRFAARSSSIGGFAEALRGSRASTRDARASWRRRGGRRSRRHPSVTRAPAASSMPSGRWPGPGGDRAGGGVEEAAGSRRRFAGRLGADGPDDDIQLGREERGETVVLFERPVEDQGRLAARLESAGERRRPARAAAAASWPTMPPPRPPPASIPARSRPGAARPS